MITPCAPKTCRGRTYESEYLTGAYTSTNPYTMATGYAAKVVYGVEAALRELLGRVAEDYGLDALELEQRYFGVADDAFPESIASSPPVKEGTKSLAKAPAKKASKEAKATGELCQGTTTKGLPCKKKAVGGKCFCAMHGPKEEGEEGTLAKKAKKAKKEGTKSLAKVPEEGEVTSPAPEPEPKKKVKKAKKKAVPVEHSHPVDDAPHDGCEGCMVHGDVEERASPEYEVRGSVRTRMMEMLSRVAAMEDEVVEDD